MTLLSRQDKSLPIAINMKAILCRSVLLLFLLSFSNIFNAQIQKSRAVTLMGSRFEITVVAENEIKAEEFISAAISEITRIEHLISDWMPHTEVSQINSNAGKLAVKVSSEVFWLAKKGVEFSEKTHGAFDISIAAMDKIWRFDDSMTEIPSANKLKNSVRHVGYQNIILDPQHTTVFLKNAGMKIGFGSIGKGYAADQARSLLQKMGAMSGIINASGDISAWGTQPDGARWTVGIYDPYKDEVLDVLQMNNNSVTTSGSYEKYAEIDGTRYSHIINPKTGMPSTGLTSVTIIGPNATDANGFSTSVMVLGKKLGKKLMKNFPEYQYVFITDRGKMIRSKNFSAALNQ